MSKIKTTKLDNGLRIVTDSVDSVHSVALGIWVGVGARDEDMEHNGAAHMVEHMMFKGTEKRGASDIAKAIENVGGNVNAYTSREITSYHIHLLKENINLALDILADMYQNSVMPEDELERERQVILQEIGMCHDTPDDLIFDNFSEIAYPDQQMGAPILGTINHVSDMSRDALMGYVERFYTPSRTVISAAGNLDHDEFVRSVEKLFGDLRPDTIQERKAAVYKGGEHRLSKDLEQSHIILGFEGVDYLDDDFYSAQALSTLLGGGMSSRLFQEVREKRGLVYSIYSFHSRSSDTGLFGIYAGTGPDKLDELMPVICEEVQKIGKTISNEEMSRVKSQLKASLLMSQESMMSRADRQAKYIINHGRVIEIDVVIEKIEAIDMAAIENVAGRIFSSGPTLAALGPLENLQSLEQLFQQHGEPALAVSS